MSNPVRDPRAPRASLPSSSSHEVPPFPTTPIRGPRASLGLPSRAPTPPTPSPVRTRGPLGTPKTPAATPTKPRYVEIDDDSADEDSDFPTPEVNTILQTQPYISPVRHKTYYEHLESVKREDDLTPVADPQDIESFVQTLSGERFNKGITLERATFNLGMTPDSGFLPGLKVALMPHQVTGVAACLKQEKSSYSGGFLADEMGLGKTMQMIAVMIKNQSQNPRCKTTLVVAPLATVGQWDAEIDKVTGPNGLKCLLYHGADKPKNPKTLLRYDVVLTTYGTLVRQHEDPQSPLFNVEFYRIILDEAHWIRNYSSKRSKSAVALRGQYRWGLSGTPMINRLGDFYAYIRFLKIACWHDFNTFKRHIIEHEAKNSTLAVKKLQEILDVFLLRRLKSTVMGGKPLLRLPEKTVVIERLEFSKEERQIYDALQFSAQNSFHHLLRNASVYKKITQVLTLLLRLRQVCSHPALVKSYIDAQDDLALQTRLTDFLTGKEEEALEEIEAEEALQKVGGEEDEEDSDSDSDDDEIDVDVNIVDENCDFVAPSTKMKFMMECITRVLGEGSGQKIIVVSQWTALLSFAAIYLQKAGITYQRYQGNMSRRQRDYSVRQFMKEDGTEPVMLLSLLCGGTGLNLTRANHLICLDLGWSPAIENQAFDRIHRLGQTRPVFIHRVVIADTVEDRILALQERKQNLADGSLGEGKGKSFRALSPKELAVLFGTTLRAR
ncbi:SNF2 family N-terminal domain-containing protein [Mycena metata]|uniref:SNF2 family N-terminal domain-containing protein n=1 Tax=Mycena metata TaxID=1033252 RepID=A0AAD7I7Q7_9AGAR|nr:SNF2 family N-terminal domain-containing protein [Mycena metata]